MAMIFLDKPWRRVLDWVGPEARPTGAYNRYMGVVERMREDWNRRAREDAYYYAGFGRRNQDEREFFASAAEVVETLARELVRLPAAPARSRRALEIGC